MKNLNLALKTAVCLSALLVSACAGPSRVADNYGDAVNSTIRGQIYDREAAENPSLDAVEGTDGQRMEAVMEAHRSQAGSAESVSNPIVINVGQ
jgi:hypothetical protein